MRRLILSPVLSTTDATCDPTRPLVLSLPGYPEFIRCCPTHHAHPSLSPEANIEAVCRASPLTIPALALVSVRRLVPSQPPLTVLRSPCSSTSTSAPPPNATAHSPLSVSPPRRAPHRPLPLSLRASALSKCVPIRVGFRPLVSSVFVGTGMVMGAAADGASRGGTRREGRGDEDGGQGVTTASEMRCTSESGPELGVAIRECALAVSAARRSAGVPTGEEEREGPGPQTVLYACGCRHPHLGRTRGRGGGPEADTHPPVLYPAYADWYGRDLPVYAWPSPGRCPRSASDRKHGAHMEGEGEGDEDEDDEDLSHAALAASLCTAKPHPLLGVPLPRRSCRSEGGAGLSPHPHHTHSRPRSRTATPTRSLGRESAAASSPWSSPRSPLILVLLLGLRPHPASPSPFTSSLPIAAIPARDTHRRDAKEGLFRPAIARAGGHADADTVTEPSWRRGAWSKAKAEIDDPRGGRIADYRPEFGGVTLAGIRSDARRGEEDGTRRRSCRRIKLGSRQRNQEFPDLRLQLPVIVGRDVKLFSSSKLEFSQVLVEGSIQAGGMKSMDKSLKKWGSKPKHRLERTKQRATGYASRIGLGTKTECEKLHDLIVQGDPRFQRRQTKKSGT
ncbi:hypothetical protein B0H14DRAFT_3178929 [Mycena olivaceomarginata]|nr:hypothetical protein B0H14DRAFT_3178929 [Mycena olivaceomarginata]